MTRRGHSLQSKLLGPLRRRRCGISLTAQKVYVASAGAGTCTRVALPSIRVAAARRYKTTLRILDGSESVISTLVLAQACATAHHEQCQALGPLVKESC